MIQSYKDLEVYQQSYQLMLEIDKAIKMLPKSEKFEMAPQLRRASRGIPPKIVEGYAKRHYLAEFKKQLRSALGESNEIEVHLQTCSDLDLLPSDLCGDLIRRYQQLGRKLNNTISNWKKF